MLAFVPPSGFTALDGRNTVTNMLLVGLLTLGLNTFNSKEVLHGEEAHHLWNPFIKKSSEGEYRCLRKIGVAWYSCANLLLMDHVLN